MFSRDLTIEQLDSLGYWRSAKRRPTKRQLLQTTCAERLALAWRWNAGRRKAVLARVRKRRPEISEAAIRDLLCNHALRDSDWEREIASRGHRSHQGSYGARNV